MSKKLMIDEWDLESNAGNWTKRMLIEEGKAIPIDLDRIKQLLDEMKEKISDLGWHSVYDEIENNITTIKQMLGIKP